uniref:Uncharacterized protein n=1 Tax=Pseudomonas aeruginosa TaxID=287 RepID=B3G2I8_PSEAI|nr:hypothetical protein PACL_0462 [Pseudomonas aeruginosa]
MKSGSSLNPRLTSQCRLIEAASVKWSNRHQVARRNSCADQFAIAGTLAPVFDAVAARCLAQYSGACSTEVAGFVTCLVCVHVLPS